MASVVKSKVANALTSAAKDHVIAVANDIYDEELNQYQSDINKNKADLVDGKIPSSQLPSYVDDVLEGYYNNSIFYKTKSGSTYSDAYTGESGKIYVDVDTNKSYRWSGSAYVEISSSLALGETSSTAYRGDRGKTAYDHSQSAHAPSNAQANTIETVKVNGTALTPDANKAVDITVPDYDDRLDDLEAKVAEIPVPSKEKYKGYITITDLLALTPDQIGVDDLYKVYASKNTDNSWDGSNFTFNNQSYPAGTFINRINGEWVVSENQEPELTKTISFDPPVERFNLITKGNALKTYPAFDGTPGWDMFHWVEYSEKNLGTGKYEKTIATGARGQQTDDFRFIFPYSKDGNYLSKIGGEDLFCPNSSQVSAMNSGITSTKVSTYDGYATSKQDALTPGTGIDITDNVITCTNSLDGYATEEWVEDKGYLTTDRTTITVGSTNLTGNSGTSKNGITLAAGNNVTLTPDATNNKVTISATVSSYYFNSRGHAGAAITDNNKWVCFATLEVPTSVTGAMSWSGNYSVVCRATHIGSLNGILTYNLRVNYYNSVSHIFLGTDNSAFAGKFKLTYNNSDRKFRLYVKEDEEWVNYTFQELQTYNSRFIAIPENEQTFSSEPTKPSSGMIGTSVCYSGGVTSVAGKTGAVTLAKSDVGLDNVGNFKAVSTVASQGLTDTEKSNARTNIGAGTSNLTIGTTSTTAAAGNHTHDTYLPKANGHVTTASSLFFDYANLVFATSGTDSNRNGDIVWQYGNGTEKARLYLSETYTSGVMPSFRVYKADGTKLKEGNFAWSDHTHSGMVTNAVNNLSTVNYLNWGTAASNSLPTTSTIAYWNGAYNSNGSSNLTYCNKGAFGTMATKNYSDYYTATSVDSMVGQREKKLSVSTDNKGGGKTGKYYLLATITVTNWLPLYSIPFIYSQCVNADPNGQGVYSGMFNIFLSDSSGSSNPYIQIDPMIADYVEVSYSGNNVYIYGKQMGTQVISHNLWTPDLNYRWSSRYTITFTQPSSSASDQDLSSVTGTKFTKKLTHPKEVICTQTEYNAITTKDSNTLYFIKG